MSNRWLRTHDAFADLKKNEAYSFALFTPDFDCPAITRIRIHFALAHENENTYYAMGIRFVFSPFYADKLVDACKSLQINYQAQSMGFEQFPLATNAEEVLIQATYYEIDTWLLTKENHTRIIDFLNYCNKKIQTNLFTSELIQEIRNCYDATKKDIFKCTHILPLAPFILWNELSSQRPPRKALADFLFSNNSNQFKRCLIEGDNPNEPLRFNGDKDHEDYHMYDPLTIAILMHASLRPLELLLWYKANPFRRFLINDAQGIYSFSPIELAFACNQWEKLRTINDVFTQPKKSPTSETKLFVSETNVFLTGTHITSQFTFNNHKTIFTQLKFVDEMSDHERDTLFQIFDQNFKSNHNKKIFNENFNGNKLIDIIYDNEKIIGFNLFEIIQTEDKKNELILHCAYAAIDSHYRGYGLMLFLAFRLAYVLKHALPQYEIGVFFCAAHYNSYRLANFPHYPKYQTSDSQLMVKNIVKTLFGEAALSHLHQHLLTNYFEDEVGVKQHVRSQHKLSLNEKIFLEEILNLGEKNTSGKTRNATVLFYVDKDNLAYTKKAAHALGVEFDKHIAAYSKDMHQFFQLTSQLTYSRPKL